MKRMHVIYHIDKEGFWAESPDMERWTAAADSLEELRTLAKEGLEFFSEEEVEMIEEFVNLQESKSA